MIASPGDVAKERQLIRDVIAEWTAVHSVDKATVLLPVSWESHSAPEMGERPQAIINERILKDCDILVACFWTRIGSPTGVAVSGTIEEIDEHTASGKPAMIYFSDAPVRMDSVDPEQYGALETFRQACKARGLYETYDSLSDFREKFSRQLAVTMIRLTGSEPTESRDNPLIGGRTGVAPPVHELSVQARKLLKTASEDNSGGIMYLTVIGGPVIQSNSVLLNKPGDARDTARWEGAIRDLEDAGLITALSPKREYFRLTNLGYDTADGISV